MNLKHAEISKGILNEKSAAPKKNAAKAPFEFLMQPLQCDMSAILICRLQNMREYHAVAAATKLDTTIPLRSAEAELQNTKIGYLIIHVYIYIYKHGIHVYNIIYKYI